LVERDRNRRVGWPGPALILFAAALLLAADAGAASASGAETAFRLKPDGTVIDQAGRRVPPQGAFKRIISLYGAHTENLFALGLGAAVIGVSPHEDAPPEALVKPVFSYRDDPERFLAARPDLVLIRPMIDRAHGQLVQRLEKSGITVVSLQPTAVRQLSVYWRILGQLTGRQAEAEAMQARFESGVAAFRALTEKIETPRRVYFEAMHRQMRTFAPGALAIFALKSAGGINVAADAPVRPDNNIALYGRERILAHAHEIDLYLAQVGVMNPVTRQQILKTPGFGVIRAVVNGEIHLIDEKQVSRPTLRLLEGIAEIGRVLYPDRFETAAPAILTRAGLAPEGGSH
jgi:iron complex transport system substrate-binding protein